MISKIYSYVKYFCNQNKSMNIDGINILKKKKKIIRNLFSIISRGTSFHNVIQIEGCIINYMYIYIYIYVRKKRRYKMMTYI